MRHARSSAGDRFSDRRSSWSSVRLPNCRRREGRVFGSQAFTLIALGQHREVQRYFRLAARIAFAFSFGHAKEAITSPLRCP
jgi:hypothetical protein